MKFEMRFEYSAFTSGMTVQRLKWHPFLSMVADKLITIIPAHADKTANRDELGMGTHAGPAAYNNYKMFPDTYDSSLVKDYSSVNRRFMVRFLKDNMEAIKAFYQYLPCVERGERDIENARIN